MIRFQIEKKVTKTGIKKLLIEGREITDSQEIANHLNNHFNEIGKKMANEIKERGTYSPLRYISKSPVQSL